jgi:hypothetical protein
LGVSPFDDVNVKKTLSCCFFPSEKKSCVCIGHLVAVSDS